MEEKLKVKLELEVPERLLSDILITAFDSMYGGCFMIDWCIAHSYDVTPADKENGQLESWNSVTIVLDESEASVGDENGRYVVNHDVLSTGIQRMLDNQHVSQEVKDILTSAVLDDDGGEIDAFLADSIVQNGIFGKDVFG